MTKEKGQAGGMDAIARSLKSSGQIAVRILFSEGKVEWMGDKPDTMAEISELPNSLTDFYKHVNPADLPQLMADLKPDLEGDVIVSNEIQRQFKYKMNNGKQISLLLKGEFIKNEGVFSGVLGASDATHSPVSFYHSSLDSTSSGATRRNLLEFLERDFQERRNAGKSGSQTGFLLLVGLDRLSLFNKAYGGNFVDSLLVEVEGQLTALLSTDAPKIVKLTGDVYACLFENKPSYEMERTAYNILNNLNHGMVQTLNGSVRLNVSIGGVLLTQRVKHPGDYIIMAETALSWAKETGRGRFVSYSENKAPSSFDARKLLQGGEEFIKCFENGQLRLAFQPVVHSGSEDTQFYESLIRMVDEDGKIIPAGYFIAHLEDLGLVHIADLFSLHQSVAELEMHEELRLSVNVSNASLQDPRWLRSVISLLRDKPQVAKRLIIEITETVIMRDLAQSTRVTRMLQELGCKIALDDFGTGHTSFVQMKDIAPDIIKIDKHFIRDIEKDENRIFVDAIQMLADGFDLETVAEGAETQKEAELLRQRGVNNIQGYAYGRPTLEREWLSQSDDAEAQQRIITRILES